MAYLGKNLENMIIEKIRIIKNYLKKSWKISKKNLKGNELLWFMDETTITINPSTSYDWMQTNTRKMLKIHHSGQKDCVIGGVSPSSGDTLFIQTDKIDSTTIQMFIQELSQNYAEYENILMVATKGRSGQILATGFGSTGKNVQRGVKMSTPVRRTGCANLKTLIETQKLIVIDKDIIDEFSTFSLKGEATGPTAKYEAEDGKHDDLVMTLVTFSWLTTQKHFRDLMESKIRESLLEDFAPNFEHDLTPYGWVMNGFEEEKPEKDPEIDGGKDLWRRVGDFNPYNDYDEDMERMRSNSRLDMDALERLNSYYGWSR
jgi:hypothetical protein